MVRGRSASQASDADSVAFAAAAAAIVLLLLTSSLVAGTVAATPLNRTGACGGQGNDTPKQ